MGNNSKNVLRVIFVIAAAIAIILGTVMCSKKSNSTPTSSNNSYTDYSNYTKILSVDDLKSVGASGKYVLNSDIDLSGEEWVPITEFNGIIDGQGHEIRNLTITSSDAKNIGFVGTLNGTIRNLTFSNANINVSAREANVGGVGGTFNKGRLEEVHVSGSVKANRSASCGGIFGYESGGSLSGVGIDNIEVVGKTNVGGYLGRYKGASISGGGNNNNVIVRGETNVGGIVGYAEYVEDMSDLKNDGEVSGESCVGGIFGYLHCNSDRTLSSFTNNGNVTGTEDNVGGIVGKVTSSYDGFVMDNFNNFGNVTGKAYTGGLFGYFATASDSTLKNSKNNSSISGKYGVGGISGYAKNLAIKKCSNEGSEIAANGYNLEDGEKRVYLGGYVGKGSYIGFEECANSVNLSAIDGACYVGGIAGYAERVEDMSDLKNDGEVSGESCVGGIFGYLHCNSDRTLSSFTNNGNITGTGDNVGGIVGKVTSSYDGFVMDNFNNFGNVTGKAYTGGLFGYFATSGTSHLYSYSTSVNACGYSKNLEIVG